MSMLEDRRLFLYTVFVVEEHFGSTPRPLLYFFVFDTETASFQLCLLIWANFPPPNPTLCRNYLRHDVTDGEHRAPPIHATLWSAVCFSFLPNTRALDLPTWIGLVTWTGSACTGSVTRVWQWNWLSAGQMRDDSRPILWKSEIPAGHFLFP